MKIILTAAATAALATSSVLAAAPAQAAYTQTIASCRAQGDFATCVAGHSVQHPLIIRVHATAIPGQHISGSWDMVCSKGSGSGSRSGSFNGWASLRHPLNIRLSKPYYRPDSCTVSADGQLNVGGRLYLWITAYKA